MVDNFSFEHKGFEGKLLAEANRIPVEEFDAMRILVQSGIGAGEYYRKKGYYNRKSRLLRHEEVRELNNRSLEIFLTIIHSLLITFHVY